MRDAPVIDVEDARVRLVRRFGPEVAAWCAGLPALADDIASRWGLRLGRAWRNGGTSVVLPCESGEGEPMVLKLTPDAKVAAEEAAALDAWTGCRHVAALLDADVGRGALLLERVLPGTRLADEPGGWALEEVLPVLTGMWRQRSWLGAGSEIPQLRERAEFVFGLTQRRLDRDPAVARLVPPGLVEASRNLAGALAGDGPVVLLHGDLHPGNVLRGGDRLVAIDPRPCLGDPAFDAVDWMLAGGGGEQAIRQRIGWLSGHAGEVDPHRAWAWCQALAVVVAVSLLSRSEDPAGEEMLAIAPRG